MINPLNIAATSAVVLVVAVAGDRWSRNRRMRGSKLPPGPAGLPLLGNIFDFPTTEESLAYKAMSRKYESDIVQLTILGMSVIVLHDMKSVRDLMESRSSLYSDRPHSVMICELMGWGNNVVFSSYGDFWRASRKVMHQEFKPLAVHNFHPGQIKAVRQLLRRLLDSPDLWLEHLKQQIAGATLDTIYGIDMAPKNDPYIDVLESAIDGVTTAAKPGAFLVDAISWLKYIPAWVPGADFQRKAIIWKEYRASSALSTYNACKQDIVEGSEKSSYCSRLLAGLDPSRDNSAEELIIRETAAALYGAGVDTVVSVLGTFFLAMVMHPEVQAKAQAEIDAVVGPGRLPTFGEEDSLPYLSAVVKECLRWQNALPLGVPHRLMADDHYNGYFLSAGSIVVVNTWAILHDENTYPDPFSFKPERFMKDGQLDPTVQDPALVAFGYGRRICPGRHLAIGNLWLTFASVLTSFNIAKAVDADGRQITPSGRYLQSLTSHVEPFKCAITPRSESVKDMILSLADEAM
ncbi:cytochrome P450 [Athelia psychrophila]|uniref:Cytochrome P450 n=1 Tax=Athelia psychrophila TaxID=1759441 RepID=A0A166L3Q4_9AGAM|nr:cytochrome P450 [Fibularhizoctonia sp. CBS 109695]